VSFEWPEVLWGLLLLPAFVLGYVALVRRRKHRALPLSNLALIREALAQGGGWRARVPPILMLLALALMIVAAARPRAEVRVPSQHETIILAMDVSGSMRATDIKPTRLAAAQEAARAFVARQPGSTKIGIVTFAGTAAVVQPPTASRDELNAAIDRFQLQRGTAIGSGLLLSLKTIFPDVEVDLRSSNPRAGAAKDAARALNAPPAAGEKAKPAPVPPGSHGAAVIVLLTDGQTTTGPDPIESAKIAADRGVRVYTVGVGTAQGEVVGVEGWSMRVRLDEETLKNVAMLTRGDYLQASDAEGLKKVYDALDSKLVFEKKTMEVTALFAAAAALLMLLASGLSVLWFHRVL